MFVAEYFSYPGEFEVTFPAYCEGSLAFNDWSLHSEPG